MTISTSIWGVQHPNAGGNIQQWIQFQHPLHRLYCRPHKLGLAIGRGRANRRHWIFHKGKQLKQDRFQTSGTNSWQFSKRLKKLAKKGLVSRTVNMVEKWCKVKFRKCLITRFAGGFLGVRSVGLLGASFQGGGRLRRLFWGDFLGLV